MTTDLLKELKANGYHFLIAKGQIGQDDWVFEPKQILLGDYYDFIDDDDIFITLEEAIAMPFEHMLNHKISLPDVD